VSVFGEVTLPQQPFRDALADRRRTTLLLFYLAALLPPECQRGDSGCLPTPPYRKRPTLNVVLPVQELQNSGEPKYQLLELRIDLRRFCFLWE
jgi:hypothetical protein